MDGAAFPIPNSCQLNQCNKGYCAVNVDGKAVGAVNGVPALFVVDQYPYIPNGGFVGGFNDNEVRYLRAVPYGAPPLPPACLRQ